jgi:hypothetical protein
LVDALGQVRYIVIPSADQNAGVDRHDTVQLDEVTAVERQNRPVARDGKGQNAGVRDALIAVTGFLGCQDVMTEFPQFFDDWKREVFVTVQPRHPLCFLVFLDCSVDRFGVRPVIGPSDRQVGLGQVWVVFSDLRIGQPQPAPRNETRDRVPRISNAWLATTHF